MLRITIDEDKDAVLRLEGQLIGPWVEDVEQCWRKAFATLGSRTVQVDLSAVNFVDGIRRCSTDPDA
jgi:anti-anti-sigma regulatory factor